MSLTERARAAFAEYAGLDAPHVPDAQVSALQVLAFRWGVRNFGCEPPHRYVLGLAEEAGELAAGRTVEEIEKELGDVAICAMQLCTSYRLDFGVLLDAADGQLAEATPPQVLVYAIGNIARAVLKAEQGVRGMDDPAAVRDAIAMGVSMICDVLKYTHPDPVAMLAARVETITKRDYKAHPVDGGR